MSTEISRSTIALAGGGHANLCALRRTGRLARRGFDVVLVDPSEHLRYSGMATGILSGSYRPGENRIDIRRPVERGGGRFVRGRVARVLYRDRALLLEDGRTVRYDAASFCLGSETRCADGTVSVKPVSNLEGVRKRLLAAEPGAASRIVTFGGWAAGCEVAANLSGLSRDAGSDAEITLVEADPDLLPDSPKVARRILREHLRGLGVGVILGRRASPTNGAAFLEDGTLVEADLLLAATGVAPPDVFARSGLATGDDGALWVGRHLRSPNDARIFGGGDAVAFCGERLPRFGVYAVRQGPVLYDNLQAPSCAGSRSPPTGRRGALPLRTRPRRRDGPRHLRPAHQPQPPRAAAQALDRRTIRAPVQLVSPLRHSSQALALSLSASWPLEARPFASAWRSWAEMPILPCVSRATVGPEPADRLVERRRWRCWLLGTWPALRTATCQYPAERPQRAD